MTDLEGKIILVTVSGPDYPGITSRLMRIIADFNVGIRDMGQAVTHGLLSLSFVLELNSGDQNKSSGAVLKDLLFEANKLGLSLSYKVVDSIIKNENLQDEKFVVTCVAPTLITSTFVADLAKILADHQINIERIDKVSPDEFSSLEIVTSIPVSLTWDKLEEELLKV